MRINLDTTLEGQRQAWHTVALYTWYYFHSLSIHQAFRIRCLMHHHTDFSEQDPGWGGAVPLPHLTHQETRPSERASHLATLQGQR